MIQLDAVQKVLELSGLESLNPVQLKAQKGGLLDGESLVVAAPTASGKTLVAEIAALDTVRRGKKVVYIVPLRALANEKYEDFKQKYEKLGVRVAMSIGDYDASDPWLANYDVVIATSEKLDSLMRHGLSWASQIGLVVADEIHLLDSPDRGPTLEVVLTRLRSLNPPPKILALSATISNYEELANWLGAKPIWSDYRPVKLYKGVCWDNEVHFIPEKRLGIGDGHMLIELVKDTLKRGKQALVFISTRKGCESTAEKLGAHVEGRLSTEELTALMETAEAVQSAVDHPTEQCRRLAECIKKGVAFHHAGLVNRQRGIVESAFKSGLIKFIFATPTLAAGINLPAYRVVVRDLRRFSQFRGMDMLPALEVEQMIGRAGRPQWDTEGEGILLPKSRLEAQIAWERYITGETERIYSKLGVEPVLRVHVLSLISSGATTKKGLLDFFWMTFFAHQYKDIQGIERIIDRVMKILEGFKFIRREGDKVEATRIGRRVAELYIDPLTANIFIETMEKSADMPALALLQTLCRAIEMKPLLSVRKKDFEPLQEALLKGQGKFLEKPPDEWDLEYDSFLKELKTAMLFMRWAEEAGEDSILKELGVTPGELRARLDNADWLLYAMQELALLLGKKESLKGIRKLRLRIKYGVSEELLPLVKLKGIGRVRARRLYNAKLTGLEPLREVSLEKLSQIVGKKTAEEIKSQLGEENPEGNSEEKELKRFIYQKSK